MKKTLIAVSLLACATLAQAESSDAVSKPKETTATLSVNVKQEAKNDTYQVRVRKQFTGKSTDEGRRMTYTPIAEAMKMLNSGKFKLSGMQTSQNRDWTPQGKDIVWTTVAEFTVESKVKDMEELNAKLSSFMESSPKYLTIDSSTYLSSEGREALEESMIQAAGKKFRAKAATIANSLGYHSYKITNVSTSSQQEFSPAPRMYAMKAMAMEAAPAMPTAPEGDSTSTLNMSGSVILLDK